MSPHHRHGRLQLIPTVKGLATTPLQDSVLGLSWRTLLCAISQGREACALLTLHRYYAAQGMLLFNAIYFSHSLKTLLLFYPKLSHPFYYHILACQGLGFPNPAIWFRLVSHLMKEKEESDGKNGDPNLVTSSAAVWEWFKEAIVGAWHARKRFCHCHSCKLLPSAAILEIGSLFFLGIFLYKKIKFRPRITFEWSYSAWCCWHHSVGCVAQVQVYSSLS